MGAQPGNPSGSPSAIQTLYVRQAGLRANEAASVKLTGVRAFPCQWHSDVMRKPYSITVAGAASD